MALRFTFRFFSNHVFATIIAGILTVLLTTFPAYAYSSTFTDSTGGWYQTVSYSSQKTTSLSHSISFGDVISITGNNHPVSRIRYFSGACTGVYCAGSVIHTVYPGTNNYAVPYYEGAKGIVIDANSYVYFTSGSGLVNPNPPPETDFYANLTTGTVPLAVQFNDSSSNAPDSFFWQFGNGLESAEKDPVIVYTDSGTYTVRHSATNDCGTTWKNVTGYISVRNATPPPQNITYYAEYWNLPNDFELLTYPEGHAGLVADCAGLGGTASSGYQRVYVYGDTGQVLNYYVSDTNGVIKGPCGEYPWHNIAVGFSPNGSAVAYDMCMNGSYPKIAYHPGNPPIVVTFNATPTTGSAPLTVQFNDTSTGAPTSWTWDFGDGTNSTMQHPLHTYDAAGNYTILHSATNALGIRWKNITDYITVTDPAPVANFTATPTSGPAPLTVTFTDTSTGAPTNWIWDFGDGNTCTDQNPSHEYTEAGTYDVSLAAANAIGSDTVVKEGYISVTGEVAGCGYPTGPYVDFFIENVTHTECDAGIWQPAVCYDNALIRWALAGESTPLHSNLTPIRWKRSQNCPNPGYSYAVDSPYNKPVYIASVTNRENDIHLFHAVDAELLTSENPGDTSWSSWKFFQYENLNINIGDWQIPAGGESFWTEVGIKEVESIICKMYDGNTLKTFYIAPNGSVFLYPRDYYTAGVSASRMGEVQQKELAVPDELKNVVTSKKRNNLYTVNSWKFDSKQNELKIYVHDVKDESTFSKLKEVRIGNYSVRVIHDKEFEKTRAYVKQQLAELMKDPAYQIAWIGAITDTTGEQPDKYIELWVYESTPENREVDTMVIQGWTIHVYPVSRR